MIIGLDTVCRIGLIKDVLLMSVRLDIKMFSQSLLFVLLSLKMPL